MPSNESAGPMQKPLLSSSVCDRGSRVDVGQATTGRRYAGRCPCPNVPQERHEGLMISDLAMEVWITWAAAQLILTSWSLKLVIAGHPQDDQI